MSDIDVLYLCGGNKGGTGKSMVATALVDAFLLRGVVPLLIETDIANPDVLKAYSREEDIGCTALSLDEADGWIELINVADKARGVPIVVNTAARSGAGMERYGPMLLGALGELNRKLVTLWVINRQRDSLELLADYLETMPAGLRHQVHVVRNLYFGFAEKFELYNGSMLKKRIEANGDKTLDFPELADRVADQIAAQRMTITEGCRELPIGNRAELMRWRNVVSAVLRQVMQ